MKLEEVRRILCADVLCGEENLGLEVSSACGSDFMSDVLTFVSPQPSLLLTGLVNPQVIRTADMVDMRCVVFVRGKVPDADILALARQRQMVVMATALRMYPACGLLYAAGLRGD